MAPEGTIANMELLSSCSYNPTSWKNLYNSCAFEQILKSHIESKVAMVTVATIEVPRSCSFAPTPPILLLELGRICAICTPPYDFFPYKFQSLTPRARMFAFAH